MLSSMRLAGMISAFALAAGPWPALLAAEPVVVGWVETVKLGTEGLAISAKLDTGADTSSLHADDIRWFTRDDGDWVSFEVANENGEKARFERRVVRIARIKRTRGDPQRRPTIMLGICLGAVYRLTQVNLVDRGRLNYDLLVGRRFLKDHFAVDSARTYTVKPRCDVSNPQ